MGWWPTNYILYNLFMCLIWKPCHQELSIVLAAVLNVGALPTHGHLWGEGAPSITIGEAHTHMVGEGGPPIAIGGGGWPTHYILDNLCVHST